MSPSWAIAPPPDSPAAALGEADPLSEGRESPLPFLRMVEHFWWSRPPHSEISSRLLHVLSEVRGCRRVVADVDRPQGRTPFIGTGVDAISRNRPGPSTTPTGEPVRPRRIIPDPDRVADVEDAPGRAPRRESSPGCGAAHPPQAGGHSKGRAKGPHLPIRRAHPPTPPAREKLNFPENNQTSRLSPHNNQRSASGSPHSPALGHVPRQARVV